MIYLDKEKNEQIMRPSLYRLHSHIFQYKKVANMTNVIVRNVVPQTFLTIMTSFIKLWYIYYFGLLSIASAAQAIKEFFWYFLTPWVTLSKFSYRPQTLLQILNSLCYAEMISISNGERNFINQSSIFEFNRYIQKYKSFLFITV